MELERETNFAHLLGTVEEAPLYSHRSFGEQFYEMKVAITRRSGYRDIIPVIISERLMLTDRPEEGERVVIHGQIRTYNKEEEGRNRLVVTVFAREFNRAEPEEIYDINQIQLSGFLCKEPVRRTSPLGREICDLMVAVNRMYNKSDYIPCIAWGRNASYGEKLEVGTKLQLEGRLQSREYKKRLEDGTVEQRRAFEVSVVKMEEIYLNHK